MEKKSGVAFHCHHDQLVEWCFDYDERVKFIKEHKPPEEQELRLRLFKLIPKDRLPGKLVKARAAYWKARAAYDWDKLHKELCPDCTWDGKTIFGGK